MCVIAYVHYVLTHVPLLLGFGLLEPTASYHRLIGTVLLWNFNYSVSPCTVNIAWHPASQLS